MTPFERGWLIGIIEADGTIIRTGRSPRVIVKMTDLDTVTRVAELFDSKVLGPYANNYPTKGPVPRRVFYMAHLNGKRAVPYLMESLQYFSERRQIQIHRVMHECSKLGATFHVWPYANHSHVAYLQDLMDRAAGERCA